MAALAETGAHRQELERRVLERTQLLQQEVEQRRRAEAATRQLYELHARLASEGNLETALDEILAAACEFTDTDRGCVQLYGRDRRSLETVVQRGHARNSPFLGQFTCHAPAPGPGGNEWEPTLFDTSEDTLARAEGIHATLSARMISRRGDVVGLVCTHYTRPYRPSDDELRLFELLAWAGADFIERYQSEAALRESEARFRALSDASPALIWQVDAHGNAVYLNKRYLDVTGRAWEDLERAGWHAILHPDDAPGYLAAVDRSLKERNGFRSRIRIRVADGGWRWFDTYAGPLFSNDDRYRGLVGLSIDITESVSGEEALRDADRRKDDFLATLAHELRNPLAPISNAVHLLRRQDGRRKVDRVMDMVGRQVNHIVKLVDDLLEVSRITRGKIELDMQRVALADIVHNAVEIAQPLVEKGGHHLAVRLPPEQVTLEADGVRMTQVLSNLLNNAAKYTDEGGQITLTARLADDQVEISVRDNGIGIPESQLSDVFEMFAQMHRDTARGSGGLGIGLTMVRNLVEMHGGTVEARSGGPGTGSEFIIRLPAAETAAAGVAAPGNEAQALPLAGQRILVVDDNHDAADSLAMLLELDGAEAGIVYDGPSALDTLADLRPHVVLLDLGMPGMDGYEVARRIRMDACYADIRIVALTGWGQESARTRTRRSGFDHHLTKPLDFEALKAWLLGR